MKTTINLIAFCVLFLAEAGCTAAGNATNENPSLKAAIEARRFVFDAQTVIPTSAKTRQIAGEGYRVRISGDSLVSYLPYFGRAYSATYNGEGGFRFTSTDFDYVVTNKKRGGWEVLLRPKDVSDIREFVLTVFENGSAQLRALSNNRQPISFNGTIAALR